MQRLLFQAALLVMPLFLYGAVDTETETKEINKLNEAYTEAFNKNDTATLSSHWLEDANYKNPITGSVVQGREAISNEMKNWFEVTKVGKLEVKGIKISFPNENSAVETGLLHLVFKDDKPAIDKAFRAELVKKDGKWYFKEIQQVDIEPAFTHYEHLKEIEWLVGNWSDEGTDVKVQTNSLWWDKYKNYIAQMIVIHTFGHKTLEMQQIIGWDPINKQIHSWIFDTDGGYGEGKWYKKGPSWFVESSYTLPDGRKASAINIYTKIDDNSFTWASEGRDLDGEILPNIDPIKIVRKNGRG